MSETLGLLLVRSGVIQRDALYKALDLQRQTGRFLGSCLLALGALSPEQLQEALAQQYGLPLADGREVLKAPRYLARLVPENVVKQHRIAPFAQEDNAIAIALYEPGARDALPEVAFYASKPVRGYLCDEAVVERVIGMLYPGLARPIMRLPQGGQTGQRGAAAGPDRAKEKPAPVPRSQPATEAMMGAFGDVDPTVVDPDQRRVDPPPTETMMEPITDPPSTSAPASEAAAPLVEPPSTQPEPLALHDRRRPSEILSSTQEIPNHDFAAALGLEDESSAPATILDVAPIPLVPKGATALEVREVEGRGPLSVIEVAEQVFETDSLAGVAEVGVAFLRGFFERAVAFDPTVEPALPLARSGFKTPARALELDKYQAIGQLLSAGQGTHGLAPSDPQWQALYDALGGPHPGVLLVAPVADGKRTRLLFYADGSQQEIYDDLHDIAVMMREIGTALSLFEGGAG